MAAQRGPDMVTPICQIAYPAIFEPKSAPGSEKKYYNATVMYNKSNPEHMKQLAEMETEAEKVLIAQWPDPKTRPRNAIKGHDKSIIKDADVNCNQKGVPFAEACPAMANHYFIRITKPETSPYPVIVYGHSGSPDPNITAEHFISGCYCRVQTNPYARPNGTNPGVSFGLNKIQWVKPGPYIGGEGGGENLFSPINDADAGFDNSDPFGDDVPF